jgi:hypothetical protein
MQPTSANADESQAKRRIMPAPKQGLHHLERAPRVGRHEPLLLRVHAAHVDEHDMTVSRRDMSRSEYRVIITR